MVRNATFRQITNSVMAAKAKKEQMHNSKSENKVEKKEDELFSNLKGKPIPGTFYGAPYANPVIDQANVWKVPGARACQGWVMDVYLNFLMRIYKNFLKMIVCGAGAVFSFIMLPGMLAAVGILFLAAAGGYFMEWRNWKFFHGYSIQRFTVVRPMGNDRYYPRYKYKKGVIPIGR
jgi:hypothetical protein